MKSEASPYARSSARQPQATKQAPAPAAPQATDKPMPPYLLEKKELVYPGGASPFPVAGPPKGPHQEGPPEHPAYPPTQVPQHKAHTGATDAAATLQALVDCTTACERCHAEMQRVQEPHHYADCLWATRACADICILLHSYVSVIHHEGIYQMSVDLAPVCARVCEACALACAKHPGMEACAACARACQACAQQCRTFAR